MSVFYSKRYGTIPSLGRYKYEYMTTPNERCDGTNGSFISSDPSLVGMDYQRERWGLSD